MSRYKHFDDDATATDLNEPAVLPELDVDEPHRLQFKPQLTYSNLSRNRIRWSFLLKRTRLEICLILTIVVLIFFTSCTLVLRRPKENKVCLTARCIQVASAIYSGLNQSVDPCDDFHEFACGRWIKGSVIPKGHSTWSITKELSKRNLIILKTILEQTPTTTELSAEQEAMKFYRSCMNLTEIERVKTRPLEHFLQTNLNLTLNEWIEIDENQTYPKLFFDLTRILSMNYGFSYILPVSIGPDDKNSSWNTIHINQPQLGLDSRDYYVNSSTNNRSDPESDARNRIIRETFANVSVALLETLGFPSDKAKERIDNIVQFEIELAKISLPLETLQKPNETYYLATLKELNEQFQPIAFDLVLFLNEMLNRNRSVPVTLTENDQVIVLSAELMKRISTLLNDYLSTPRKSHIVIDHLLFSLIFDLSPHLNSAFEKLILPLYKELYGIESLPDRWEYCVKETDAAFGDALGALYVKNVFGETDRQEANQLISKIRQVFQENLDRVQWIDQKSRDEAKKKLKKITEKVGYPNYIHNRTALNERYLGSSMSDDDYFYNGIKVLQRERRRSLSKFRQKVDLIDWSMTPRTVNAYYTPSANEIVFPAGILQPPFFHKDLPLAVNYGAIGTVIGHEITHGFDDQGREYDADGNMRSWWTKLALERFEERTKCFVKQYSSFALDGQNENGQRTLSENIADNGGLKLSYLGYRNHRESASSYRKDLILPGLPYTSDQLFFIAFAHSWCSVDTRNAMHYDLINDPHSPPRFRILGTMANSEDFSRAFSCSANSRMNPNQKCQLW